MVRINNIRQAADLLEESITGSETVALHALENACWIGLARRVRLSDDIAYSTHLITPENGVLSGHYDLTLKEAHESFVDRIKSYERWES